MLSSFSSLRNLHVRTARSDDNGFCLSLLRDLLRTTSPSPVPKKDKFIDSFNRCLMNPKNSPIFIAEDGGKKLGMAACNIIESVGFGCKALNLGFLIVDKNARGRKVGEKLILHCKKYCQDNNLGYLELYQPPADDPDHEKRTRFYTSQGLKTLGPARVAIVDESIL